MTFANTDLINGKVFQVAEFRFRELPIEVGFVDSPNHVLAHAQIHADVGYCHHLPEIYRQPCEALSVVLQWNNLRQRNVPYAIAYATFHSWCLDRNQGCP